MSEPELTQSLSQSSSADARPPLPPSSPIVLRDQPNAGVLDEQQRKGGDKNTNDCDLLLIVYHRVEERWKKTERNPLQIELSLFEPGLLQKNTNSMTEAINDNGTIIYSDLSERLISHH